MRCYGKFPHHRLKAWPIWLSGTLTFATAPTALADAQPQHSMQSAWWVPLISALIGALSALATPFAKDLVIRRLNDKRSKSETQHEIFRNYAAPLAASCEKLIWRFSEIFIDKRHQFLKTATSPLVFNEYKRKSTLYRIASLLGWLRAIHLELSALPRGASGFFTPVSDAIGKVQSALADGPYVELHRLEQLCTIWRLSLDALDHGTKKSLATSFEVKLYDLAGDTLKHDSEHLKKLDHDRKLNICRHLSAFLCKELRRVAISEDVVAETMHQAIVALSYREALIYRDWQDAIGDAMLELDPDSIRRFKIVGYEKFEEILMGQSLWIEVFRESINDIDFDAIDPNDFRAKQLRDLAVAVCQIMTSLAQTEERDLISDSVLEIAQKISAVEAAAGQGTFPISRPNAKQARG